jgi:hypothetical protein
MNTEIVSVNYLHFDDSFMYRISPVLTPSWFAKYLQVNATIIPQITSRSAPNLFLLLHYSLITLSFHSVNSSTAQNQIYISV